MAPHGHSWVAIPPGGCTLEMDLWPLLHEDAHQEVGREEPDQRVENE